MVEWTCEAGGRASYPRNRRNSNQGFSFGCFEEPSNGVEGLAELFVEPPISSNLCGSERKQSTRIIWSSFTK